MLSFFFFFFFSKLLKNKSEKRFRNITSQTSSKIFHHCHNKISQKKIKAGASPSHNAKFQKTEFMVIHRVGCTLVKMGHP